MKLSAVALDYDGTVAFNDRFDPAVRDAAAILRRQGIRVVLVTGRRVDDLRSVAGDLACFEVIVAENGAVLEFPPTGRHAVLAQKPNPIFLEALQRRGVAFTAGECIVEAAAASAGVVLDTVRSLELPLVLAFNRGRLMVLPPAIAKSTGLRHALRALRVSVHNTLAVGDAENDHDLLDACEVGVAVEWGSPALKAVADEIVRGSEPRAVADYLLRVSAQPRLSAQQMGRRHVTLGYEMTGEPVRLALRGRTILIAGEPGTGKSWLAGLLCEQLILQGYCICVIDPEGDYRSLEAMPEVTVLGGDGPPPTPRELADVLHYPDVSVVIDLSRLGHTEKVQYVHGLLPFLASLRRETGLPHKILLDEAHYFLQGTERTALIDPQLAGYIIVTYRVSAIDLVIRPPGDAVVLVTRETDEEELRVLTTMSRPRPGETPSCAVCAGLRLNEGVLLPGPEEAHGTARRFVLMPRLTEHVRHRAKYLDMPVADTHAFVFTDGGQPGARARTLKELIGLLHAPPPARMRGHLQRQDFSRWIEDVFRDHELAARVRLHEERAAMDGESIALESIAQAICARYETATMLDATPAELTHQSGMGADKAQTASAA